MNIGQLVRIGGRTRLSATFSLVGLTGIVVPTAPGAPSGCVTVWVNWQDAGYENIDELPPAVNVPAEHLELLTAQDAEDARIAAQPAPKLTSVGIGAAPAASTREAAKETPIAVAPQLAEIPQTMEAIPSVDDSQEETASPETSAADNTERPKLRLI